MQNWDNIRRQAPSLSHTCHKGEARKEKVSGGACDVGTVRISGTSRVDKVGYIQKFPGQILEAETIRMIHSMAEII